ncbi:MAG TPA: TRAP transporter large permease subunit, partial [Limnochordales bacterium]
MAGAAWLLLGSFFLLLLLRVPIGVALGASSFLTIWRYDLGVPVISYNFWAGIAKFPLLAIPFFILAGVLMDKAGMAERIVRLMRVLVGHWPGGLGLVAVIVAIFWGAVSGSGPATVAALGTVLIPGMARLGYEKKFATAIISATSELSIVIPPSIALIIYATLAN